ncbi:hypothetical protein SDC9_193795 [bioreactor metagenome]|uniref:Uncharacterized protein n=1 Tax=bioreactor metagenome TaxID=1076179 RepID=A0A645I5Z2_9ZZZZ
MRHILQTPAHETLDRDNGVLGVGSLSFGCGQADIDTAVGTIADDGWQHGATSVIGQTDSDAVAHRRHQRIRSAKVDADGKPVLVRLGRHPGFSDLQQGHQGFPGSGLERL